MSNLVFVYGSLKSGHWNNCLLEKAEFLGKAVTKDRFLMTTVGFPYMIPENLVDDKTKLKPVVGEVYRVEDTLTRKRLDNLEGVDCGHYRHEEVTVRLGDSWVKTIAYVPCDESVQHYQVINSTNEDCYEF